MICLAKVQNPLGGGFLGCATNVATVWALAGILSPWQAVQAFSKFKLHLWALEIKLEFKQSLPPDCVLGNQYQLWSISSDTRKAHAN